MVNSWTLKLCQIKATVSSSISVETLTVKIQTRIWTQNTGTLGCMKPLLTWSSTHRLKKAKSRQGFLKLLPLILIWRIHVCERPGHALTGFKRLCRLCGLMKNCLDYACCGHSSSLIRLRHCRQLTEAQQCPSAATQSIRVICRQHRSALPVAIVPLRDFSRTNQPLSPSTVFFWVNA